jgi:hypothetical protein
MFDPIGYSFSYDFEHDIAQTYGAKISMGGGMFILRDEIDESVVELLRAATIVEDIKDGVRDITTNSAPVTLKKLSTKAIMARSRIALKLMDISVHLLSSKIHIENFIHVRVNPISNTC